MRIFNKKDKGYILTSTIIIFLMLFNIILYLFLNLNTIISYENRDYDLNQNKCNLKNELIVTIYAKEKEFIEREVKRFIKNPNTKTKKYSLNSEGYYIKGFLEKKLYLDRKDLSKYEIRIFDRKRSLNLKAKINILNKYLLESSGYIDKRKVDNPNKYIKFLENIDNIKLNNTKVYNKSLKINENMEISGIIVVKNGNIEVSKGKKLVVDGYVMTKDENIGEIVYKYNKDILLNCIEDIDQFLDIHIESITIK